MAKQPETPDPSTTTKRKYGKGYLKDPEGLDQRPTRALFGAIKSLPLEASMEAFVPFIADQVETSTCTGQGIGGAIDCRLRKMGRHDAPLVSRQGIYTIGRSIDRVSTKTPLSDDGANPSQVMRGLRQWGVPTSDRWPFDPATVNEELPWDVLQEASAFEITAWWQIYSSGKSRIEEMCQALAAGYPVAFGVDVDRPFEDASGPKPIHSLDPTKSLGGHMMHAVGYRTVNGARQIRCVNSWGVGWGDRGLYWAEEPFFLNASGIYVIQVG